MDIEDDEIKNYKKYINLGIQEFKREYDVSLVEILSNREVLRGLIKFLKEECKLKYIEIQNYFEMTRGTMEAIRRKAE